MRLQRESLARLEEADETGRQRKLVLAGRQQLIETGEPLFAAGVVRLEQDLRPGVRRDLAGSQDIQRDVHAERAGMKQVERPDVDGAASKIGAARCGGDDRVAGNALRNQLRKAWHRLHVY